MIAYEFPLFDAMHCTAGMLSGILIHNDTTWVLKPTSGTLHPQNSLFLWEVLCQIYERLNRQTFSAFSTCLNMTGGEELSLSGLYLPQWQSQLYRRSGGMNDPP